MYEKIFIIFTIINLPIFLFYNQIIKYVSIYDKADSIRKFHKNKVPISGGIILIYNLITFFLINSLIFNERLLNLDFDTRELSSFILGLVLFFIIGLYDDKFNLSPNYKLSLNFFLLIFLIFLDDNLLIQELDFSFIDHPIELRNFSYVFTILCILLFINALNMFDGINLQAGTYCIIILSIFIFKGSFVQLAIICGLAILVFLFFNIKNKSFLGDSGTQVLAFLISYILIKSHNSNKFFTPEEIFIILAIPGLDMLRLFLQRLIKGKNPFYPDRNHIHHIVLNKLSENSSFIIIQILILTNLAIYNYLDQKFVSVIFCVIFYLVFIVFFLIKGNRPE